MAQWIFFIYQSIWLAKKFQKDHFGHWAKVMCGRFQVGQSPTSLNWNTLLGGEKNLCYHEWMDSFSNHFNVWSHTVNQTTVNSTQLDFNASFMCLWLCSKLYSNHEQLKKGSFQLQVWTKPENLSLCWMTLFCVPFFKLPITLWYYSLLCFPFGK